MSINPCRGEIWQINFEPNIGAEIDKDRPALVISEDSIGKLPLRIVVPITDWNPSFNKFPWFVKISPTVANGLTKDCGADAFQVKSISFYRFLRKRGVLLPSLVDEVAAAIGIVVGL